MYIYRALNDCDIKLNPKENGLFGKSIITSAVADSFSFIFSQTEELKKYQLNDKEIKNLFYSVKPSFCDDFHINEIINKGKEEIEYQINLQSYLGQHLEEISKVDEALSHHYEQEKINNYISNCPYERNRVRSLMENGSIKSFMLLSYLLQYIDEDHTICEFLDMMYDYLDIYRTVNTHITFGNEVETNWISFSKSLDIVLNDYYLKQKNKHMIAVVESNITKTLDGKLFGLDLSDDNAIREISVFLINKKNLDNTKLNYRGLNYAKSNKEVIYYTYVPIEKIKTILGALQADLLYNDVYNTNMFESKYHCNLLYGLKKLIKDKIEEEGLTQLLNIFDLVYEKDIPIDTIVSKGNYSKEYLLEAKRKILSYANSEENILIKPFNTQKIILPEK